MPRRPEIGNVQLYPDRPLRKSDRNGYVLKFYCPILCKRIRRNCGTRDRREARRIQRECQERLLNGEYVASNGAFTAGIVSDRPLPTVPQSVEMTSADQGPFWDECYEKYIEYQKARRRVRSVSDTVSRLGIAESVFLQFVSSRNMEGKLQLTVLATVEAVEYLQSRLLSGEQGRFAKRSPNTVNSVVRVVMAFFRFCHARRWIKELPYVEKFSTDNVMRGRPITDLEFQRMLEATESVVGRSQATAWKFALMVLWESAFRIQELMDFSWNDTRHIHPVWGRTGREHPTILIPSTQKNGKCQEIPMLPGLVRLLDSVPGHEREGWVVRPPYIEHEPNESVSRRPCSVQLAKLLSKYRISAVARMSGVSVTAVKKWNGGPPRGNQHQLAESIPDDVWQDAVSQGAECPIRIRRKPTGTPNAEYVSKVISMIGRVADVKVQIDDTRTGKRLKFASAHDIRRGVASRLINSGISAETLKLIMRHRSFTTTEKHYGAIRSAQSAAAELATKLEPRENSAFVGGLVGGHGQLTQLSPEEVSFLKSLLSKL